MSACPACESRALSPVLTKSSAVGIVELVRCSRCGLVMQAHREAAYAADLYRYYAKLERATVDELYPALNDKRQRELLAHFARAPGRRLLDVGCGVGQFARTASREGWNARGIDLSTDAVKIARAHGVPCEVIDFFSSQLEAQRFDVITMFEFIEHVAAPLPFIERAAALLARGGLLYLTTPNFDSLERWILGMDWRVVHPEHLLYFTPRSLRRVVEHQGRFSVLQVDAHNVSGEALGRLRNLVVRPQPAAPRDGGDLRAAVESSSLTRVAKSGVNRVLSQFGAGATLKVLAVRN